MSYYRVSVQQVVEGQEVSEIVFYSDDLQFFENRDVTVERSVGESPKLATGRTTFSISGTELAESPPEVEVG